LWTWIYILDDRIDFGGVKVKRLVHDTIQISNSVTSFDLEWFWKLISCGK
jgi:hypothetical protein